MQLSSAWSLDWASKLRIRPGFLEHVFKYLDIAGENKELSEKVIVVQYDEMKVKELYEYDTKLDQILGPHKQMQVIMSRGLLQLETANLS